MIRSDYKAAQQNAVDSNKKTRQDNIYAKQQAVEPFSFNEQVVKVFPDMIGRSVPGYWLATELSGVIATRFAQPGTNIYDLGCSLGAAAWTIHHYVGEKVCNIIAVDNSQPMLKKFKQNLEQYTKPHNIVLRNEDIQQSVIENASVVVLNYALQFLSPPQRLNLLKNIHRGLTDKGVLLLSEKITFEDPDTQTRLVDWHHDFKRANGYSDLEIAQKRRALENVMITDTLSQHKERIMAAGFSKMTIWFQCYNFVSIVAEK